MRIIGKLKSGGGLGVCYKSKSKGKVIINVQKPCKKQQLVVTTQDIDVLQIEYHSSPGAAYRY